MGTFTSLNAATVTGPGTPKHLGKITAHHSIFVFTSNPPIQCEVRLEGSHDGTNWRPLGSATFGGETSAGFTTSPNNFLVSDIRANLVLLDAPGGTTVTATICSDD